MNTTFVLMSERPPVPDASPEANIHEGDEDKLMVILDWEVVIEVARLLLLRFQRKAPHLPKDEVLTFI